MQSADRIIGEAAVLRVYEHQQIRIGEAIGGCVFTQRHFDALLRFAEQRGERFFLLGHRAIRLRQYVGIISTDACTLEILPKVDEATATDEPIWQSMLIDMLRACRFIRPEQLISRQLAVRPGSLLEWYLDTFFTELEALVRYGLLCTYTRHDQNSKTLKGQLKFAEHLKRNYIRRDRFYVSFDQYTEEHWANLTIGAALILLDRLPLSADRRLRLRRLQRAFPRPATDHVVWHKALSHPHDRQLDRYESALIIARHIIRQELPDIQAGAQTGLALLFDMNLLFEEFIFQQLRRWLPPGASLERQLSLAFWERNRLRPDLVLQTGSGRMVIDTKWRMLRRQQPTADELRQIYVYCDYFGADTGVLLYPHTSSAADTAIRAFAPAPQRSGSRFCRIELASVLDEQGRLNQQLGQELLNTWLGEHLPV